MGTSRKLFAAAIAALTMLPAAAHALLFRAYLSSSGLDTNPCTVTAPCRLLPAAIAAVVDGGEIWILDSANFNTATVYVYKSVSIAGAAGQLASLVTTGGGAAMGIAPGVRVALRNLSFSDNVTSPGYEAISVGAGAKLSVEDCAFTNLAFEAIYADPYGVDNSGTVIHVKDSVFRNVGGVRGSSYWVAVRPGGGATVDITNSQFLSAGGVMAFGNRDGTTTTISLTDSHLADGFMGAAAYSYVAGAAARVFVTRTTLENLEYATNAQTTGVGTATVTLSDSVSVGNYRGYFANGVGASTVSLGNNHITDNALTTGGLTPVARQ